MDPQTKGAKIFEGRTAEVYEWGDDRVLKLYISGFERAAEMEAASLKTSAAAGISVPKYFQTLQVEHRCGIVMERIQGETMLNVAMEHPERQVELGNLLADLQISLYQVIPSGPLKNRIQCLHQDLVAADLPRATRGRLLERLKNFDTGDRLLCHYDLHAGNIILSPEPVILDWVDASVGPPLCDFTRTLLLHGYPDHTGSRMEAFVNAILVKGSQLLGVTNDDIDFWLPIVAGARMAEGFKGAEAEYLLGLAEKVSGW